MRTLLAAAIFLTAVFASAQSAPQRAELSPETAQQVADIATKTLHDTGVPSASIAIVEDGHVAYAQAFGLANVTPPRAATAGMAYPIGSISKQFTASAVLLLQQRGKLSIDDPVAKYFPNFTRANEVTLRNLMTMTSGYEDFAPQDYIIPAWRNSIDPLANVTAWATKPLDFSPGTDWQYSNTNYVILGLIVQKVSGQPLMQFIRENVLDPLHLQGGVPDGRSLPGGVQGVFNAYTQREKLEVTGYVSNAMAPVRVQPLEGNGWYFGDGDLVMPASTLAAWDIGIMHHSLLSAASYQQFEDPFILKNGTNTHYALGTYSRDLNGHHMLEHGGEVGGYVAENVVFPDDGLAIVVLTNEVASEAASDIAHRLTALLLPAATSHPTPADTFAPKLQTILTGLQHSHIDRSLFTPDCNDYFNADTLADFQSTLVPLGSITSVTRSRTSQRGGMTFGLYRVSFSNGETVLVTVYLEPGGKIEQLLVIGKA